MVNGFPTRDTTPAPALRPVRDLAGTDVRDASGVSIGELWGALADDETGLIRYLDVALERTPRHVLVPIGHARLRATDRDHEVRLRAALLEELAAIPAFDPTQQLNEPYENALLHAHGELFHGERYYAHPSFDHRGLYAGQHPIARDEGVRADSGLHPLRTLHGYRIARDQPDVRGWPLVGDAAEPLGIIDDLIVDIDAEQVRYVMVDADARRVLVPIGFLEVDTDAERVVAPGMRGDDVARQPAYDGGPVERAFEQRIRAAIEEAFRGPRRYQLPDYQHPRGEAP